MRRDFCAAQTNFFLHAECQTQLNILWRMFEQFNQDDNANAVINRLGYNGRPNVLELCRKSGAVADFRFALRTKIDPH